jgi:hypothetical protein
MAMDSLSQRLGNDNLKRRLQAQGRDHKVSSDNLENLSTVLEYGREVALWIGWTSSDTNNEEYKK